MKDISKLLNFGILNIDKPAGWTSFDVVNFVRKTLEIEKAGHLGTLDPEVTGVLPIVLGKACKIQEFLMHKDKTYIGMMKIHKKVPKEKLEDEMKKFLGVINQLPPRISRVKRQVRQREIIKFELKRYDEKKGEAEFTAEVEAGTYIRKLIDDLGKGIGGAHMASLRRTKAGVFTEKDKEFTNIEKFKEVAEKMKQGDKKEMEKIIIPAEEIIKKVMHFYEVKEEHIIKLKNGSPLFEEMLADENNIEKIRQNKELFAIFCKGKIIEIAEYSEQFENPSILAKPETVLA